MEISTDAGAEALSAADQLRLEGRKEGREEGAINKQQEIVKFTLLARKLNPDEITELTGISLHFIQEVQKELGFK